MAYWPLQGPVNFFFPLAFCYLLESAFVLFMARLGGFGRQRLTEGQAARAAWRKSELHRVTLASGHSVSHIPGEMPNDNVFTLH